MTSVLKAGNAMAVAPHFLAAQAARDVMKEGGNAIEAMVAAAATIAMVYPHMTGLGGDAFWLIHEPGHQPVAIDASGGAAAGLTPSFYTSRGLHSIPVRGPLAANTIAGTVSGWERALEISKLSWGGRLPLSRLFADAIHHAEHGVAVTASQMRSTATKLPELAQQPGFSKCFLSDDKPPAQHSLFFLPRMAALLRHLARTGGQHGGCPFAIIVKGNRGVGGRGFTSLLHALISSKPVGRRSEGREGGRPWRHCKFFTSKPLLCKA